MRVLGYKELINGDNIMERQRIRSIKKYLSMKEVLRKFKANITMIQETKKNLQLIKNAFKSLWGGRKKEWFFNTAQGSVGGLMIAWKNIC